MAGDDRSVWGLLAIGLQLTLAMVVLVFAGQWVDAKMGWSPWGTLLITMGGLALVLYFTLKDVLK